MSHPQAALSALGRLSAEAATHLRPGVDRHIGHFLTPKLDLFGFESGSYWVRLGSYGRFIGQNWVRFGFVWVCLALFFPN